MTLKEFLDNPSICPYARRKLLRAKTTAERLGLLLEHESWRHWLWFRASLAYQGSHTFSVFPCRACRRKRELDQLTMEERLLFALMWLDWLGVKG